MNPGTILLMLVEQRETIAAQAAELQARAARIAALEQQLAGR